jgi:hypothetical protein
MVNLTALGQIDTIRVTETGIDTANVKEVQVKKHSPRRATILSAALPGLGQAYNKKYWKIPIIYAGASVLGYFMLTNYQKYRTFQDAYVAFRASNGKNYILDRTKYPDPRYENQQNLENLSRSWRRNWEYTIILSGLLYALNIVDANVDAHLKGFELGNQDLTFSVKPKFSQPNLLQPSPGLALRLTLK